LAGREAGAAFTAFAVRLLRVATGSAGVVGAAMLSVAITFARGVRFLGAGAGVASGAAAVVLRRLRVSLIVNLPCRHVFEYSRTCHGFSYK
jgi:hypothetical protein